ncbi:MAG: ABC transporter ATP-binding protein [Acidobacteriota bacterium]
MTPLRRLLQYFDLFRLPLLLGGLAVIGSSVFSLAKPLIVGRAVDGLTAGVNRTALMQFAALYIGASACQGIFLYLQRWIIIGVSRKMEYTMRRDFYGHLQSLPITFYNEHRTGDLMSRATNDLSSVRMLIGPAVMHSFSSLLIVAGAFVMMFRINHALALVSLAAVPVVAGLAKVFGARIHDRFKDVQDYFGDLSARVQENLSGVRVVRAFSQESNEISTFKRMNREYVERNRILIKLTAVFYPLLHVLIGVMFVVIFFLGTRRIIGGTLTLGEFVAFQFYLGRMIWPLIALGWVINLFQRGMASMGRLSYVWDQSPAADPDEPCIPARPEGRIEVRNLDFSYGTTPVLHDVSLRIEPGQTIGIVGRTGSGKSTLLSLLTGLYSPPPRSIFIDGCALESIPVATLRSMIGVVPQETFLFSDSIAENIRVGRADADDVEVHEVAELAGLGGDLVTFPDGMNTVVGERGITLSGGQKQRTAIARAIVRDPMILLLDDSLSAVDTATEERILRALREIRRGRTVVVVSHRVSSVKDADAIVVLDEGRIVERGTHEALIGLGGYYANLYRRQALEEEIEEIA